MTHNLVKGLQHEESVYKESNRGGWRYVLLSEPLSHTKALNRPNYTCADLSRASGVKCLTSGVTHFMIGRRRLSTTAAALAISMEGNPWPVVIISLYILFMWSRRRRVMWVNWPWMLKREDRCTVRRIGSIRPEAPSLNRRFPHHLSDGPAAETWARSFSHRLAGRTVFTFSSRAFLFLTVTHNVLATGILFLYLFLLGSETLVRLSYFINF